MSPSTLLLRVILIYGLLRLNRAHLLSCLIYIEALVLYGFYTFNKSGLLGGLTGGVLMCYFVLTVASAAVGLRLLVSISRRHGKDFLATINLLF